MYVYETASHRWISDAHIRIHARDTSTGNTLWQRHKPPLRLPLACIRAPYICISVDCQNRHDNIRVSGDEELGDGFSFDMDWGTEREDDVFASSVIGS